MADSWCKKVILSTYFSERFGQISIPINIISKSKLIANRKKKFKQHSERRAAIRVAAVEAVPDIRASHMGDGPE